jgi:membrane protease YdiL (CAAX protease family)
VQNIINSLKKRKKLNSLITSVLIRGLLAIPPTDEPVSNMECSFIPETGGVLEQISVETLEKTDEEKSKTKKLRIFTAIPILFIALAEFLIISGRIQTAIWIHIGLLISLTLSSIFIKDSEIHKMHQSLILLPVLRLINLSMPAYYEKTLYSFILPYGILAIPVSIALTNQGLTRTQLGMTFKKIWLYSPLSILLGLLLGGGEYLIIRTNSLILDLSTFNLLMLSIVMIFFVGLVEEVIFRSILQNRLQIALGNLSGLVITSILFGLMHTGYGGRSEVLYASFVGIFVGYLFYKTRSLPLVMMIHGFINVFVFGIIPLLL